MNENFGKWQLGVTFGFADENGDFGGAHAAGIVE